MEEVLLTVPQSYCHTITVVLNYSKYYLQEVNIWMKMPKSVRQNIVQTCQLSGTKCV